MDLQILNTVLQSLLDQLSLAYGRVLPTACYFFYIFATINLVKLGLEFAFDQNANILAVLLKEFFKMGFVLWSINSLPYLHEVLRDGAIKLGIQAAGGHETVSLILNPSNVAVLGFKTIIPIRIWIYSMSWKLGNIGPNIVNVLLGSLSIILIIGAYFYLAYQMFMSLIDFYFTSVMAPIFLAFQVCAATAWIASGSIRGPIQHAVKLFTMSFIISLAEIWIADLILTDNVDLTTIGALVLGSITLVSLSLKAGTWAAGMFSGNPIASAGDLITTGAAVAGLGAASAIAGNRMLQSAQSGAASIARGSIATTAAAVTSAKLHSAAYSGNPLGQIAATTYGAAKGAFGMLSQTSKATQQRITESFQQSVSSGIRQGFISSGGSYQAQNSDPTNYLKYQRISQAFQEHQNFNNRM